MNIKNEAELVIHRRELVLKKAAEKVAESRLSADFQKGLDAYDRGDHQAALREWRPLAEQGDAETQYEFG